MEAIYDAKAYKQAYVISNFLIDTGEIVMTQKLLDTLEARMDKDYYFDMNDINNIELLPDTEKILTQIYLECLAPAREKEKILKLTKELKKIILNEDDKNANEQKSLILADLTGLKFFEKIRIKLNRLISFCQA